MIYKKYFLLISFFIFYFLLDNQIFAHDFDTWLINLKQEAKEKNISEKTLNKAFKNIKYNEKVIELDRNQPDFTLSFNEYMTKVVPQTRIDKAKKMMKKHRALLKEISQKYGVQERFIVALWGIESDFGDRYGDFYLPEVLATLAYDGRRSKFFKSELINLLTIIDKNHINHKHAIGSWAGAMGQTQFMPSSFLAYGTDYNNDGKIDLWKNHGDIFASIANYLKSEGWNGNMTWGRKVKVPSTMLVNKDGWKYNKKLSDWNAMGITNIDGKNLPNDNISAAIMSPDDNPQNAFLVYSNFKTIMHWNKSVYFCLAVSYLSDQLYGI